VEEYVFDVALKRLDTQLYNHLSTTELEEIILVEFARDDYVEALQHFSLATLKDAYFIFIDTPMDICIQRVKLRMIHPMSSDDHYISEEAIQKFYTKQDISAENMLVGAFRKIENSSSWSEFLKNIDNVVDDIFK